MKFYGCSKYLFFQENTTFEIAINFTNHIGLLYYWKIMSYTFLLYQGTGDKVKRAELEGNTSEMDEREG